MGYVFLLISVISSSLNSVGSKLYQMHTKKGIIPNLIFTCGACAIALLIETVISGFSIQFTLTSFLIALLSAACLIANTPLQLLAISLGNLGVVVMFMQSGSIILPLIYGSIFLKEKISWLNAIGLALITISLLISIEKQKGQKWNVKFVVCCIITFFISGIYMVAIKLHQSLSNIVSEANFLFIQHLITTVGLTVFLCIYFILQRKKSNDIQRVKMLKKQRALQITGIALFGISICATFFFSLKAAALLAATVMFPIMSGGVIITSHIAGAILEKKKLSVKTVISIVLCIGAIICFAF